MMRPMHAFTLLELMIVLAIAGALALVAMSAWPEYSERNRRAAARAALIATLAQTELMHAEAHDRDDTASRIPMPRVDGYTIIGNQPCTLPSRHCTMAIAIPDRADPVCGTLSLNSTGEHAPHDPACWP